MAADERPAGQLSPHDALRRGHWIKLICGASNQDLPAITDLCAVYGAAGIDCVDVAADPAVVRAARQGLQWLDQLGMGLGNVTTRNVPPRDCAPKQRGGRGVCL